MREKFRDRLYFCVPQIWWHCQITHITSDINGGSLRAKLYNYVNDIMISAAFKVVSPN